ncbi:MAG: UDP-3-O-(3-hydroxymyristoyl)glucosamine N-acyltransferase [Planctomycetota bacterium]
MKKTLSVREIAERIGGQVAGDPERLVSGAASIARAGPGDLVFADGPRHVKELDGSRAAAAIVPEGARAPAHMSAILVPHPAIAMAKALEILFPRERIFRDVSPAAFLGEGVEISEGVGIGPGAYVGDRARLGRGTEIHPLATIARDVVIGEDCVIHSGVHLYPGTSVGNRVIIHSGAVIGADGFGFVQEVLPRGETPPDEPMRHHKVPQVGRVVIEDDVEIGANTCIDRAALDETRVGRGTKIDDLVMIGHNTRVGRHAILVAQCGIAGSVTIGDYVTIAGQAGLADHISIGSRVIIGAQAGVTKSFPDGQVIVGSPAIDLRKARKAYALIEDLPEFKRAIQDLTRRLDALEGKPPEGAPPQAAPPNADPAA